MYSQSPWIQLACIVLFFFGATAQLSIVPSAAVIALPEPTQVSQPENADTQPSDQSTKDPAPEAENETPTDETPIDQNDPVDPNDPLDVSNEDTPIENDPVNDTPVDEVPTNESPTTDPIQPTNPENPLDSPLEPQSEPQPGQESPTVSSIILPSPMARDCLFVADHGRSVVQEPSPDTSSPIPPEQPLPEEPIDPVEPLDPEQSLDSPAEPVVSSDIPIDILPHQQVSPQQQLRMDA